MQFLPQDLVERIQDANMSQAKRKSRLHIRAKDEIWPILRKWDGGFSLDARKINTLRGLVHVYERANHVASWLILASDVEGNELICTVKCAQVVQNRPALDFERDENAPLALLPNY